MPAHPTPIPVLPGWSTQARRRFEHEPAATLAHLQAHGYEAVRVDTHRVVLIGGSVARAALVREGRDLGADGLDMPDPRTDPRVRLEWMHLRQSMQVVMTQLARTTPERVDQLVTTELPRLLTAFPDTDFLDTARHINAVITIRALLPDADMPLIEAAITASTTQLRHLDGLPRRWGRKRRAQDLRDRSTQLREALHAHITGGADTTRVLLERLNPDQDTAIKGLTNALAASHAIPGTALAWLMVELANHPDHTQRIRAAAPATRQTLIDGVVHETLRLHPPAWMLMRQATTDVTLNGWTIPAGDQVLISPYFAHRDPAYWDHPGQFTPDRWAAATIPRTAFLPYGAGPRICPGLNFANRIMTSAASYIANHPPTPATFTPTYGVLHTPTPHN